MKCPGCGKQVEKTFCDDCRPKETLHAKDIEVKACVRCHKTQYKNKWSDTPLGKVVYKTAKDKIKEKNIFIVFDMPKLQYKPGLELVVDIDVQKGNDHFDVPAKVLMTYCMTCAKGQGNYFEGILQLRNMNDEVFEFVQSYLEKVNLFVSKEKKFKKGYDMQVSDNKKLQQLGQALLKEFGGVIKVSPKLFSKNRQTSKEVYRVTLLYVAPDYKIGDVLELEDKLVYIKSVGKSLTGVNLYTGKNAAIDVKNEEYVVLTPQSTTISKLYPNIEILDPDTFQSVPVSNKKEVKNGEKVKVVASKGKYYLL